VLSWLTGNFESPTCLPPRSSSQWCASPTRLPDCRERGPPEPRRVERDGAAAAACVLLCEATGWQVGVSWEQSLECSPCPRLCTLKKARARQKIGCPSLIPRMGGSYGAPTSLRERAKGGRQQGWKGRGASGTTLAHGLALRTLHRPAEGLVRTCAASQRRDVPNRPKPIVTLLTFLPSASSHPPQAAQPSCPTPDSRTGNTASIASVTSTQNSDYWTGLPFWDSWPCPSHPGNPTQIPSHPPPSDRSSILFNMLTIPPYSCLHIHFHKDPRHLFRFFVNATIRSHHQISYHRTRLRQPQHKPQQQLLPSC
jgi:hypothetical protein